MTNTRLRRTFAALLKERHLHERGLADSLRVSPSTLTSVGRSPAGPTLATLLLIKEKLNLDAIDDLLGESSGDSASTAPVSEAVYVAGPFGFTEPGRRYLAEAVLRPSCLRA